MEKLGRFIDKVIDNAVAISIICIMLLILTAPSEPVVHEYCSKKFGDQNITEVVMCLWDHAIWSKASKWISNHFFSSAESVVEMTMREWGHFFYLILILIPSLFFSMVVAYSFAADIQDLHLFPKRKFTEESTKSKRLPFALYLIITGFIITATEYPKNSLVDGQQAEYLYVFVGAWIILVGIGMCFAGKIWGKLVVKE